MAAQMQFEYVWTEDNLRLMGVHFPGNEICVLAIHGMSGNIIENYWAHILGEKLADMNCGFLYAHNRGYGHVNDISTKPTTKDDGWNTTHLGVTYELFEDSPKDIDAWINRAASLGYRKIILLGHSLGCNKVIYYLSAHHQDLITGIILASPPDMVGLVELEKYQPDHQELLLAARKLVQSGKPRELLQSKVWDWYRLSAGTYLSLFEKGGPADNLPVLRNPESFEQLASIQIPILGIMGEYDDIGIRDLHDDIELIKSKATTCEDFEIKFISHANHDYQNHEVEFAGIVASWVGEHR